MKKRILIVDDDHVLNKINEKVLSAAGLVSEIHISLNGLQALEYLTQRIEKNYPLPDFIILDLNMPVMSGFEFIDAFNALDMPGKANTQLIVFTASTRPSDMHLATSKGIMHYLNKPYLMRGLCDIIHRSNYKATYRPISL